MLDYESYDELLHCIGAGQGGGFGITVWCGDHARLGAAGRRVGLVVSRVSGHLRDGTATAPKGDTARFQTASSGAALRSNIGLAHYVLAGSNENDQNPNRIGKAQ